MKILQSVLDNRSKYHTRQPTAGTCRLQKSSLDSRITTADIKAAHLSLAGLRPAKHMLACMPMHHAWIDQGLLSFLFQSLAYNIRRCVFYFILFYLLINWISSVDSTNRRPETSAWARRHKEQPSSTLAIVINHTPMISIDMTGIKSPLSRRAHKTLGSWHSTSTNNISVNCTHPTNWRLRVAVVLHIFGCFVNFYTDVGCS